MNMKTKHIICALALTLTLGATTSCEDMFTTESGLIETDMAPKDTLYRVMGIVRGMQKIADKSILLGEVRADLVDINAFTTTALQELSNNNISTSNAYNTPQDFYSVINACNIYLNNVDTLREAKGKQFFREEIIAVKTFRAWTYLELAKIYGTVPFITEPVLTAVGGETEVSNTGNRKDLVAICDFMIDDLLRYANLDENNTLRPDYNARFAGVESRRSFIPVRLMLAELYLYRGSFTHNQDDFINAVRLYHDYLAFPNEEIVTGNYKVEWTGNTFKNTISTYINRFSLGSASTNEYLAIVPMDTIGYYGNYTDIRTVFNSQYSNNYYANVNPSSRMLEISQAQSNCVYVYNSATDVDTVYAPTTKEAFSDWDNPERYVGDLRYQSVYNTYNMSDMYHAEYSTNRQYIIKYLGGSSSILTDVRPNFVPLYRKSTVYLHLAEALNRAGFPETAFAILKYGISDTVLGDSTKVSKDEYTRLQAITSYGFASNAADWDREVFFTQDRFSGNATGGGGAGTTTTSLNQLGIHSYGSGDAWANKYYYLPTDSSGIQPYPEYNPPVGDGENPVSDEELEAYEAEYQAALQAVIDANEAYLATDEVREKRMAALEKIILDEEALECAYEGTRFYDLMRYSMYNYGNFSALVEAVSQRKGAENTNPTGTLTSTNVYLPLIAR